MDNNNSYTNVLQLGNRLHKEFRKTLEDNELIGISEWDYLLNSLSSFLDALADPLVSDNLDNYKIQRVNPIERLGLTSMVIQLIENGLTPKEISREYKGQGISISINDIESLLDSYNTAPITEKIERNNLSVFDTSQQLELLLSEILNITQEIEEISDEELKNARTTRSDIKIKLSAERRQTIKDAASLAQAIQMLQDTQNFKKAVLEEIGKLDHRTQQIIMRKIKQVSLPYSITT